MCIYTLTLSHTNILHIPSFTNTHPPQYACIFRCVCVWRSQYCSGIFVIFLQCVLRGMRWWRACTGTGWRACTGTGWRACTGTGWRACTGTGWRTCIGCLKWHVSLCNIAIIYGALLRKMTYKDQASHASSLPCIRPGAVVGGLVD